MKDAQSKVLTENINKYIKLAPLLQVREIGLNWQQLLNYFNLFPIIIFGTALLPPFQGRVGVGKFQTFSFSSSCSLYIGHLTLFI
jgi:hypothetical protein